MSTANDLEMRRLELEAQEKREARRAELFKWFVAFAWPSILTLLTAVIDSRQRQIIAEKADTAAAAAQVVAQKVDEIDRVASGTYAINAEWKAARTGDPDDMAKAQEAERRLEKVADSKR